MKCKFFSLKITGNILTETLTYVIKMKMLRNREGAPQKTGIFQTWVLGFVIFFVEQI